MKISYANEFKKKINFLPARVKRIFQKQEKIFSENWKDPRLHIKKLRGYDNTFSFRITRQYRVLFSLTEDDLAFFVSAGHRKDVYD